MTLSNPRWEQFAAAVASGMPVGKASRFAGYAENSGNVGRLRRNPEIAQRIEELVQQRLEQATGITPVVVAEMDDMQRAVRAGDAIDPGWIVHELLTNVGLARAAGNIAASNSALIALGRQVGLFVEKPWSKRALAEQARREAQAAKSRTPSSGISIGQVSALLDRLEIAAPAVNVDKAMPAGDGLLRPH